MFSPLALALLDVGVAHMGEEAVQPKEGVVGAGVDHAGDAVVSSRRLILTI